MAYYNNQAILIRGSLADGAAIDHDDADDCDGFDDDERKDNNYGDDYDSNLNISGRWCCNLNLYKHLQQSKHLKGQL